MSYLVIKIPGVVPPNIWRLLEARVMAEAHALVPDAEAQGWSGPLFDRYWMDIAEKLSAMEDEA